LGRTENGNINKKLNLLMSGHFSFFLVMIVAIVLITALANKIKVAYPILLVLVGIAFSFIPGMPVINIRPEMIFLIVLPPLLYGAAWSISWKELWRWRRIIGSFAFGVVFVTAVSVAVVADCCIPGFSLALGFLLGGVVSPPDAVSAGAILKFVKVPKRMSSVLEGESLLNDASSLIIFRFALIAVITGRFIWHAAVLDFGWMLIGGVSIGLAVGWIFMKAHRILKTDIDGDIALTLVAPYVMYMLAEAAHSSGVIAVVSGGLLLSSKRYVFLSSHTRLRGGNIWESLLFVLNGFVFMLIGLDLPEILGALQPESIRLSTAVGYGVLITAVLIGSRILFSFMAVLITLLASRFIKVADARNPGYQTPIVFGWTGMRGVVSLAAALSIPLEMSKGVPFPQRNLLIFIKFLSCWPLYCYKV
jgi:CPA1 family monovalent cation:H+ antiporter